MKAKRDIRECLEDPCGYLGRYMKKGATWVGSGLDDDGQKERNDSFATENSGLGSGIFSDWLHPVLFSVPDVKRGNSVRLQLIINPSYYLA